MAIPVRSPFTSAMNTGTPMREKLSASFCSVTVLPVPVAPVMQPCRFASAGSSPISVVPVIAMINGSLMFFPLDFARSLAKAVAGGGSPGSAVR